MITKTLLKISLLIVFILIFTGGIFYWGIYLPKDISGEDVFFVVKKGESLSDVAENLMEKEVIKSGHFFIIHGIVTEKGKKLQPGNYKISSSMSVVEVMEIIVTGGKDRLTIIEGWNLRDIAEFLEKNGYGSKEDFYFLAGKPPIYKEGEVIAEKANEMEVELKILQDKPDNISLEGYLFPDTYSISPGTKMEDIIHSFLLNFDGKITPEIKERVKEKEMSLFEMITIASLIEKEVTSLEDKKLVSGIIEKRLQRGMRLQMDATITYLTGRRSVQIPLTETKIDSSYNTYLYHGLPKGPICSPGMESINAALNPKESDYLYYLSKPSGETVFSKTHEEHVQAKNNYLR